LGKYVEFMVRKCGKGNAQKYMGRMRRDERERRVFAQIALDGGGKKQFTQQPECIQSTSIHSLAGTGVGRMVWPKPKTHIYIVANNRWTKQKKRGGGKEERDKLQTDFFVV
jgi:hypothetical protein